MEKLLYKTMKKTILFFLILSCILPINFSFAEQDDASIEVKVAVLKDFPPQYSLSKYGQPQGFAIDITPMSYRTQRSMKHLQNLKNGHNYPNF
jgi:hypothetical protein